MKLSNEFYNLGDVFYSEHLPTPKHNPKLLIKNDDVMHIFNINNSDEELAYICSGNKIITPSTPYALVYAGHQFGSFNPRLGDGRAVSLGNIYNTSGNLYEISLKGCGPTTYSRGADGLLALGPAVREYLISEYFRVLSIPTTLSLALTTSDDMVLREQALPAAVLTRVAGSFMRIGTFEYFLNIGNNSAIKQLLDYLIMHYYTDVATKDYLALFKHICLRQAHLIAQWQSIGFIHGVMNTDNMSIVGETIDYGPCAFLDEYQADKVFSSIDRGGRYAFNNQMSICLWNLTSLANCIITQYSDKQAVVDNFKHILIDTNKQYQKLYYRQMCTKLAISYDSDVVDTLLLLLAEYKVDYTNFFVNLTHLSAVQLQQKYHTSNKLLAWLTQWQQLRKPDYKQHMCKTNAYLIPRNHLIEEVIVEANQGEFNKFYQLLTRLQSPFSDVYQSHKFTQAPLENERITQTFCGT